MTPLRQLMMIERYRQGLWGVAILISFSLDITGDWLRWADPALAHGKPVSMPVLTTVVIVIALGVVVAVLPKARMRLRGEGLLPTWHHHERILGELGSRQRKAFRDHLAASWAMNASFAALALFARRDVDTPSLGASCILLLAIFQIYRVFRMTENVD